MTPLPASVPHSGGLELGCWILEDFRGLRALRAGMREEVELLEADVAGLVDLIDRMAVVVTELATNGLRHGAPPTVVRLLLSEYYLIIDVSDRGMDWEPDFHVERPPGHGGLGLLLTRTFARDAGWYRTDSLKHVWASFAM